MSESKSNKTSNDSVLLPADIDAILDEFGHLLQSYPGSLENYHS
ncbi:hypothetical protein [Tenuibacillus multivorans]|nr:hypothetical protein [Tenuibacillus multivorans]GEL76711.1 hypothetical protein TMU01_09460 [Tenuibacillus multivorans]